MRQQVNRELFYKEENGKRVDYSTKFARKIKLIKDNLGKVL